MFAFRPSILCFAACLAACSSSAPAPTETPESQPAARPPAPEFTRTLVLVGSDGLEVAVAEFGEGEAFVRMNGHGDPLSDAVMRCRIDSDSRRTRYETQWKGRTRAFLQKDGEEWVLYTSQNQTRPLSLKYDDARSKGFDADSLYSQHMDQRDDGTLEAITAFDRAGEERGHDEKFRANLASVSERCGANPKASIDWSSVSDELMEEYAIASWCGRVLEALEHICSTETGKRFVQTQVSELRCRWADERGFSMQDGVVDWVVSTKDGSNLADKAKAAFLAQPTATDASLQQAIDLEKTDVCIDEGAEHVIVVYPGYGAEKDGIAYGNRETLYFTAQPQYLSRGWFFEPRRFNPSYNDNFRGRDLRSYSRIDIEAKDSNCKLVCGERETSFQLASAEQKREILQGATEQPAPFDREPHALLRDRRGNYYYIDRGNTEESRRDFRVFTGPRGRMKQRRMKDIVSDSQGEIFSTAAGELRLLVNKDEALWVARNQRRRLQRVPIQKNYRLIFEELGVYFNQPLGTPCDDF